MSTNMTVTTSKITIIISNNNSNDSNRRGSALTCDLVLLIEYVEADEEDDAANSNKIISSRRRRSQWNGPKSVVAVAIGLDKLTKLSAVFAAYVQFCKNTYHTTTSHNRHTNSGMMSPSDLEFYHCQVLRGSDTAEASALMKNDRLYCRTSAKHGHRQMEAERLREQRESDRQYLERMRHLLEINIPTNLDTNTNNNTNANNTSNSITHTNQLWLHCIGKCKDARGLHQQVLTPYVRAHSALLHKRCPWLSAKIKLSSLTNNANNANHYHYHHHLKNTNNHTNANANANNLIPYNHNRNNNTHAHGHGLARVPDGADDDDRKPPGDDTDEDDDNLIRPLPPNNNNNNPNVLAAVNNNNNNPNPARAAEVEDDEEEEQQSQSRSQLQQQRKNNNHIHRNNNDFAAYNNINNNNNATNRIAIPPEDNHPHSLMEGTYRNNHNIHINNNNNHNNNYAKTVYVTLQHPPEAVKLLLEYCYTNRVVPLGRLAFMESCRSPDPYTTDPTFLPFLGPVPPKNLVSTPTISFAVALAGIQLAEEAMMPRLSLMCEVAASQLVSQSTVLEALAVCATQEKETGNCLPRLRKAAMLQHIFSDGKRGIVDLYAMPSFRRTLEERSDLVVPSLLMGTYEVMKEILTQGPTSDGELHYDSRVLAALFGIANNSNSTNNSRKDSKKKGSTYNNSTSTSTTNNNNNINNANATGCVKHYFSMLDHQDALDRAKERYQRRNERWAKRPRHRNKNPYILEDSLDSEFLFDNNNNKNNNNDLATHNSNSSIIANDDNMIQAEKTSASSASAAAAAVFGRLFGSSGSNNSVGSATTAITSNRRSFSGTAGVGSHLRLISNNNRNSILLGGSSGRTSGVRSRKRRSHSSSSNQNNNMGGKNG